MPPRLLPKEYGFIDTVRRDDAQSVWMSGKFVNHLAAMPSMHFGWSFMIGCTLIYHSGVLGCVGLSYGGRKGKSVQMVGKWWKVWYCALGIAYPTMILVTIIATANHVCLSHPIRNLILHTKYWHSKIQYWLDAIAGGLVAAVALLCNRVFLVLIPLEDLLLWVLRIEKPKPNCGTSRR